MKLLLVEDDLTIAEFIKHGFKEHGFHVDHTEHGSDAYFMAGKQSYDAAIIDLMIPGIDGLTLIKQLRESGQTLPIIVLSALSSVTDRVKGLETGCDDYLTKPFSFIELHARIQALLRRPAELTETHELTLNDLTLNRLSKTVSRSGKEIVLQPKEWSLLEYLLQNPGKVLSKTMILEQIWDYHFDPQTNVVDVLVCRLRAKIDKNQPKKLLHTLRGVGYVLKEIEN